MNIACLLKCSLGKICKLSKEEKWKDFKTPTDFAGPKSGVQRRTGAKGQAIAVWPRDAFELLAVLHKHCDMDDLKAVICITMTLKTDSLS